MLGCLGATCVCSVVKRIAQPATGVGIDAHVLTLVELDSCGMIHFGRGETKVLQGGIAMFHSVRFVWEVVHRKGLKFCIDHLSYFNSYNM